MRDDGVTLRLAGAADLPALMRLAADAAVAPFLAPEAAGALGAATEAGELYAIDAGERVAGGLRLVTVNERNRIADIRTLMIDPGRRGTGTGAAALRALCRLAFGDLALHRLQAETFAFNHAALVTFERAGFRREGVRRRAWHRHGAWQDGVLLGRVAEDPEP